MSICGLLFISVVPTCNELFDFFLEILTLKTFNLHVVYEGFRLPVTSKLLHYTLLYIYMYIIYEYISSLMKIHALKKTCKYNLNLHLPCYVPPQVSRDFSFPKRATKIAFHGGDF